MELVPPIYYYFFIGKTNSIDTHESTIVFNMLDHLLTSMWLYKHRNLKGQLNKPYRLCWGARSVQTVLNVNLQNSRSGSQLTIPIYMKSFS